MSNHSDQSKEWTEDSVEKLWRSNGGWALTNNPYKAISDAHNAALASAIKRAYKKGWNEHRKYRRLAF